MSTHQGPAHRLPVPTRAWRRVLDAPVAVAALTVALTLALTLAKAVVALVSTPSPGQTSASTLSTALSTALTGAGASAGAAGTVLLVVSLLVGLPHGAVDLLRPEVLDPGAPSRSRRLVTAAYLGCAAAAVVCWLVLPLPTLLTLLALAAVHFGAADDVTARWRARGTGPVHPPLPVLRVLRAVAAGAVPVTVPLGLHGAAVRDVLDGLSGGHAPLVLACSRLGAVLALAAATGALGVALARARWAAAAETAALTALFVLLTPLLAFAVYFGLWHSWRQVARMVAADAVREGTGPGRALARFCRGAAVPTALTVAAGSGAVAAGGSSVLVVGLALVLCLTVPHSVVVARSDRRLRWARGDGERPPVSPRCPPGAGPRAPGSRPAAGTAAAAPRSGR
ncbi:beta-carotene 15,15'-dioxygenase, Brp/Blh family [Kineococcus sp. LSe6-4]|uniref:Probable beta-carotene 15,15'-dioxygenase n=1 Tax=Kineococcus halophytocola TaxID=3234027 RepID=A0ABV4GZD1_9ACTN